MIAFKACPHCHGDLCISLDNESSCLQCGYQIRIVTGKLVPVEKNQSKPGAYEKRPLTIEVWRGASLQRR